MARFSGNCNAVIGTDFDVERDEFGNIVKVTRQEDILCRKRIDTKKTMHLRKIYGFDHLANEQCLKHLMIGIQTMNGVPVEEMKSILEKLN